MRIVVVGFFVGALSIAIGPRSVGSAEAPGDPARPVGVFTPKHTASLRVVTSARMSPDGTRIAYTLAVPRDPFSEPSGPAWEELHVTLPVGRSRPFVSGEVQVHSVDWTPAGDAITFLAKRDKDKFVSLYYIPADGGEARRILSHVEDIGSYSVRADGLEVAFTASEPLPEAEQKLRERGFREEVYEESYRPVRVHLARLERTADDGVRAGAVRTLALEGHASLIRFAPTGNLLAALLAPTPLVDDAYMRRRLHTVDAATGAVVAQWDKTGKFGDLAWSPDARHIACIAAEDEHDPSAGRLFVVPATGGNPVQLLPGFEGEVTDLAWKDADTIIYAASVGVWSTLGEVRLSGGAPSVRIPPGRAVFSGMSASRDARTLAFISDSSRHPPEVHVFASGNEFPLRLTDSNPWIADLRLAPEEPVTFAARDGLSLEGILIRPLDEEKGRRYPLILSVHGGPEAHERMGWLTSYSKPGQTAAARGYAVFYPNYRGSTGRGVAFSKLGQGDAAGKEFDDLVDAVDALAAAGLADPAKIGITGGSYGGYASAWAATRLSNRFAASVMFVGISDLISKVGTTDIPLEDYLVHSRRHLHEDWQGFLERSPIFHAKEARTPILILHGKDDPRVNPGQSLELYRRLKTLAQVPVRLVWYPGEGHGNRSSASRLDYNIRMLQWFDHYLKGPGGPPPDWKIALEE
jgi:dipeptidyl aminopeptidase/acylaminoacyl peptidase